MPDRNVLIAICALGIGALVVHLLELWEWWTREQPIIDTSTNGGVKVGWDR